MPQNSSKSRAGGGRYTPRQESSAGGRYTQPIPREVKRSPQWYPYMLLTLLVGGILAIIFNYLQFLPSSPTNWYTLGGLVAILASALLATRYR